MLLTVPPPVNSGALLELSPDLCDHPADRVRSVALVELQTGAPAGVALACDRCSLLLTLGRDSLEAAVA